MKQPSSLFCLILPSPLLSHLLQKGEHLVVGVHQVLHNGLPLLEVVVSDQLEPVPVHVEHILYFEGLGPDVVVIVLGVHYREVVLGWRAATDLACPHEYPLLAPVGDTVELEILQDKLAQGIVLALLPGLPHKAEHHAEEKKTTHAPTVSLAQFPLFEDAFIDEEEIFELGVDANSILYFFELGDAIQLVDGDVHVDLLFGLH